MNLFVLFFAYFDWLIGLMHWIVILLGVLCKYYFINEKLQSGWLRTC